MKHHIPKQAFNRIVIFVAAFAVFFAFMDSIGATMWASIGGWQGEAYITAMPAYMAQFWTFAYAMIFLAAIFYFIFTKDWSETVAIVIAGFASVWGGVEDLAFYIFRNLSLDASMPWLIDSPVGTVARILGNTTVTPTTLILNIILYLGGAYLIINWLYKQKW